jgi:hypothetical protein
MSVLTQLHASIGLRLTRNATKAAPRQLRVLLHPGELYALRAPYSRVRVVAGCAYISHAGMDFLLGARQVQEFTGEAAALISVAKGQTTIVEIN